MDIDPIEQELGITTYLCPDVVGFSAVLKARYSDFVVHEVASDGTVARLTCVEPRLITDPPLSQQPAEPPKAKEDQAADETNEKKRKHEEEVNEPVANPDWEALQRSFAELVGVEASVATMQFLKSIEAHSSAETESTAIKPDEEADKAQPQYNVSLPPVTDKKIRKTVHEWVRENLAGIARSDTLDIDKLETNKVIRVWHQKFTRKMPNWKAFEQNRNNNNQRRDNRPQVRKPPPGMKFLRFVLYKENMDTTHAINQLSRVNGNHGRKLRVGYSGMKDKRGITSQFVTVPAQTPIASLTRYNISHDSHRGGGHTRNQGVGVLRVGNFEYVAEDLRMGRLQGNRFDVALRNVQLEGLALHDMKERLARAALFLKDNGFINYFGVQRFGKFHDTHLTGIEVLKGNYEKAIDIIMEPKPNESEFMTTARKDWRNRFEAAEDRETAEKDCASRLVRNVNRNLNNSENSALNSLAKHPLDYKRAYGCIQKTMRMMFLHAVQSYCWNHVASFRIDTLGRQVVKGDLVSASTDDKFAVKLVTAEDIAASRYRLEDVLIPMIGTKTKDPENLAGEHFDKLLAKMELDRSVFEKLDEREFDLCGDYRTLICPSAELDYKIIEYTDSHQPLIQTDLMKLHGIEVEEASSANADPNKILLAMDVAFTLPSSTYATIALRELMKKPTSSEYQSELKLHNS
ncbi:hypothetical protein MPSEU_000641400 [Mayamaea pseudoterrestris]|nr:hypothetical protein MPSEU_000641400 [Mayamaea pseudoterrestris]